MELQELLQGIKENKEEIRKEFITHLEDDDKTIQEATQEDISTYIASLYYDLVNEVEDRKDIDTVEQAIADVLQEVISEELKASFKEYAEEYKKEYPDFPVNNYVIESFLKDTNNTKPESISILKNYLYLESNL